LGRDLAAEVRHLHLDQPAPGALGLATLSSLPRRPPFQDSNATAIWFLELGPTPFTREEVPGEAGISRRLAAFHLDKLVVRGLLPGHNGRRRIASFRAPVDRRPTLAQEGQLALDRPPLHGTSSTACSGTRRASAAAGSQDCTDVAATSMPRSPLPHGVVERATPTGRQTVLTSAPATARWPCGSVRFVRSSSNSVPVVHRQFSNTCCVADCRVLGALG
jgi:hypothetical protein